MNTVHKCVYPFSARNGFSLLLILLACHQVGASPTNGRQLSVSAVGVASSSGFKLSAPLLIPFHSGSELLFHLRILLIMHKR